MPTEPATIQLPKIVSVFQNLQELNISHTNAEDECFKILGMYCKDLKYGENNSFMFVRKEC